MFLAMKLRQYILSKSEAEVCAVGKMRDFVVDAGGWGVSSVLAAFIVFAFGVWEHTHERPIPGFTFLCLSIPLFWIGAYAAWAKKRNELDRAKERYQVERPRLDIEPTKEPELTDLQGPPRFWIRNVGGRPSRFTKFEPLKSELGHYILEFEEVPLIAVGAREPLNYRFVDAITSYDGRNGISWLKLFLNDRPEGSVGAVYVLHAKYQDVDCATEFTESFAIEYAALDGTISTRPMRSLFVLRD